MRRTDRQVTDLTEIAAILNRCDTIRLGLQGEEYPYVVPLSFGWELVDGTIYIYFHGAKEGWKHDLIAKNNRVCVEADRFICYAGDENSATTRYESIIGFGTVAVCDYETSIRGIELLMAHCGFPGYRGDQCIRKGHTKVYRITLNTVTGKRSKGAEPG